MPQDHIDYAVKNGSDALALTDHGNMNGFSYQYLHAKKLKDKGVPFKALSGVEAYYIPSLSEWRKLKTAQDEAKAAEKEAKKLATNPENIGDELASAKAELEEMAGVVKTDEDEEGGTVVENEDDSKSNKYRDPIQRRNHLVLLPKNTAGLKTLFRLVSNSYIDGFYKYPRIDLDMLKREAKGNIIALSACIAGADMHIIASHQTEPDYHKWSPNNVNFDLIQSELKDMIYAFKDALGEENYYLEAQFNALNAQHLKNFHIMEAAKRTNTNLVVTCDSHYSNPDHWRERELYKAMAWASKSKEGVDTSKLPQKIEELKCELYPKNAQQIWDSYKTYGAGYDFYDDDVVRQAIERTWDIAHNQIGSVDFDRSVKLPVIEKLVSKTHLESSIEKLGEGADEDVLAFEELKRLAKEGLKNRKRDDDAEYIDRLVYELGVIKELKFAKYFLTYAKVMDITSKQMLIGYGRGSAAGSLLSYCLEITQVDPLRYGLLFERFLTRLKKNSYPDIDCLHADMLVLMSDMSYKKIKDIQVGDKIMDHFGAPQKILGVYPRISNNTDIIYNVFVKQNKQYGSFIATSNHRLISEDGKEIKIENLKIGSRIHNLNCHNEELIVVDIKPCKNSTINLVDITVEETSTFQFVPFNCCEFNTNAGNYIISINNYSIDTDEFSSLFEEWYYDHEDEQDSRITRI